MSLLMQYPNETRRMEEVELPFRAELLVCLWSSPFLAQSSYSALRLCHGCHELMVQPETLTKQSSHCHNDSIGRCHHQQKQWRWEPGWRGFRDDGVQTHSKENDSNRIMKEEKHKSCCGDSDQMSLATVHTSCQGPTDNENGKLPWLKL